MKICRFCQHQQESGESCEQCGAPLAADKLDFSDSGSSGPDVTVSSEPDLTASTDADNAQRAENKEATGKTTKSKNDESSGKEVLLDGNGRKILYSAKEAGESVYLGNKGLALIKSSQVNTSDRLDGIAPYDTKKYDSIYKMSKYALCINAGCLVCCCVSNLVPFILGLFSFTKISKVMKGKDKDPEQSAKSARSLAIASFILLALWGLVLAYIILFTDLIDQL